MPKSTILLVHGMGKPTDEMFSQWQLTLKNIYEQYSKGESFEDRFDCINIEYDSIFESRRSAWADQVDEILDSGATSVDLPSREDLEDITGDNFFTTHVQDVLLYRFIPQIAENVRAHVITKITDAIQAAHSSSKVSIIAHSLGTSVIHDAVNAMYLTADQQGNTLLSPGSFRFQTIAMIANVSRTLSTRWDAYDSLVRPGHDASDNYVTQKFLTSSHKFDPLVSLRRFAPVENWPDSETVTKGRVSVEEPGIITGANIHDFSHYLANPLVHVPLFRFLRHQWFISKEVQKNAEKKYFDENPIQQFENHLNNLKSILTGEADFSWKRLVNVYKDFRKFVEELES